MTARVVSFVMEKGGVGKTTSAVNVAADLARKGKRVLLIDSDAQGNATWSCYGGEIVNGTLYDCFGTTMLEEKSIIHTEHGFDLMPANGDLSVVEAKFTGYDELRTMLEAPKARYDFILIDLPPALSYLTICGLAASTEVMIPVQPEILAVDGLKSLLQTLELVKENFNPNLFIAGVFMTMYQDTRRLHRLVRRQVKEYFDHVGIQVCQTEIKRSIHFAEAPMINTPALLEFKNNHAVQAYSRLVREVFGV